MSGPEGIKKDFSPPLPSGLEAKMLRQLVALGECIEIEALQLATIGIKITSWDVIIFFSLKEVLVSSSCHL